jgi:hypothetical protein
MAKKGPSKVPPSRESARTSGGRKDGDSTRALISWGYCTTFRSALHRSAHIVRVHRENLRTYQHVRLVVFIHRHLC